ncbi:flippase [Mycobacterium sp. 1164966.3]|uniref:flippase n=1 Tax=Mycobacterium sp. 1164966.3 TaxID=1856861 RepID=UPI0009EF6B70|nr:flippase [Mycobacterium sp. 1164966.3]
MSKPVTEAQPDRAVGSDSSAVTGPAEVQAGRIAHAVIVQMICRALGMLASVISVAMTARYLGPGRYGQLTIAVAFIGMWTSLADLGIGTVIVRRVTSGRGDLERLVRVNSGLSLVYCVPLATVAALCGLLIYRDADVRVMLVVLSGQLLMLTMKTRFEPVFLSTVRFSAVAFSDIAGRLATLAVVTWLVTQRADVIWFAVAQLLPPLLQLLIQGTAAAQHISLRPAFAPQEAKDLLRESLPLMGVMVVGILYWRTDGVILSLVSSPAEVGVYGLAYTIAFNTEALSTFFLKSTLATATTLFSRDVAAFARFLRRSVELMYFVAIPVAVVGALLAGPLIGLFGDAAYVGRGTPTLGLLFIAVALRFVSATLGQGLFASHQQRFFFRLFLVALALNIALNLALDGRFGAVGAGIALVCTELFGLVLAGWRLRRECDYRGPGLFLLRTLIPTSVSVVAALLLSGQHVVLTLAGAAAAYLIVSLAIGPVNWSTLSSLYRKQVVT